MRGTHAHGWVSTHPAFYSPHTACGKCYSLQSRFEEIKYIDSEQKYVIRIGHDVWIGAGVLFLNGVTIGNGVVIAAGAAVTKDAPPYHIVGGAPAKNWAAF